MESANWANSLHQTALTGKEDIVMIDTSSQATAGIVEVQLPLVLKSGRVQIDSAKFLKLSGVKISGTVQLSPGYPTSRRYVCTLPPGITTEKADEDPITEYSRGEELLFSHHYPDGAAHFIEPGPTIWILAEMSKFGDDPLVSSGSPLKGLGYRELHTVSRGPNYISCRPPKGHTIRDHANGLDEEIIGPGDIVLFTNFLDPTYPRLLFPARRKRAPTRTKL